MTTTPQLALVLRNGLLLMLSLAAVDRLGLPEGLFLALAILVVLEADLGGGVIAGRERVIGSLMGLLAVVISVYGIKVFQNWRDAQVVLGRHSSRWKLLVLMLLLVLL